MVDFDGDAGGEDTGDFEKGRDNRDSVDVGDGDGEPSLVLFVVTDIVGVDVGL